MSDSRLTQPVVLANGGRVPLEVASANFALLNAYLAEPDSEWDVVYYLREVCLGRPIDPEQTRALVHEKLLAPDGSVDPAMRAVVLSAVRGEGRVLHLASPFTDPTDRALSEFLTARDHIQSYLSDSEVKTVLDDPVQRALKTPPKRWTDREGKRTDPPPDGPATPPK
jgi:hypothetical protein